MGRIKTWLRKLGWGQAEPELTQLEIEDLREAFKARYHNFKLLLAANNKALDIMSDMEQALRGHRPFGLAFVRANCTAVSVNVFRIVKNLDQLAPNKYEDLYERIKTIQASINHVLSKRRTLTGDQPVAFFDEIDKDMADQVGSKMANLGEVTRRLDLSVPPGFVITSHAYQRFLEYNDLQPEIDRRLQSSTGEQLDELYSLSSDIQQLIIHSTLPPDLESAIIDAYHRLESRTQSGVRVSMRSSALGEDTHGTSFAGQYRSELNISINHLLQTYKEIVASKYTLQAIAYRLNRGILDEDIAMCVGCMAMVNAVAGGVTYSRNPLNIRDDAVLINSVWGLPKSVVDGALPTDLFVVARGEPLTIRVRDVKDKKHQFTCLPEEGVCRLEMTDGRSHKPSLTDEQIRAIAQMALKLEAYYGTPQDVEWAVDQNGNIYLLQCRPLQQMDTTRPQTGNSEPEEGVEGAVAQGGETASPGLACGPVFVVRRSNDALMFPQRAVLVIAQALPRWAALLSRASAVVAEQGSVAGHLANVAREFGVPALFGVAGAVDLLTNGQEVTVDADGLRVYPGRVEALLTRADDRKNLMEGSPVHEVLKEVTQYIVPLHLLDPDSTEFKPKSCRTLHDITRFCHEKAVKEMFNFGKEHRFSERASKQLVYNVPMQWWVINLDDGFKEDVTGKFVHLNNIVSIPMLALWEGIVAVPWQGPPPVDTKGFMSVLMEASTNPNLDPSMPSHYFNRNYFMISKNFCSLNSRFGFHFCTVETLVSERPHENYISFQFKGGAADYTRRLRRARFVGNIVEEFGFRMELKEDGVFVRMEGYPEEVMTEKLKIIGYLLIHTRQLDMIMSNDAAYNDHRRKIITDLEKVLGSQANLSIYQV